MDASRFWSLLEQIQYLSFGINHTVLVRTCDNTIALDFELTGKDDLALTSSCEVFFFNFKSVETHNFPQPEGAKLCTIQSTESGKYLRYGTEDNTNISLTNELSEECYFFVLPATANTTPLAICTAQTQHYFTLNEDKHISLSTSPELAAHFEIFFKCTIYNSITSQYLSIDKDEKAPMARNSNVDSSHEVFLIQLASVCSIISPITNKFWCVKDATEVVLGPKEEYLPLYVVPREGHPEEFSFFLLSGEQKYISISADNRISIETATDFDKGYFTVKPHPIPKMDHSPPLLECNREELGTPECKKNSDNSKKFQIIQITHEKGKIESLLHIAQQEGNKFDKALIFCSDSFFAKKIIKKLQSIKCIALYFRKENATEQCESISQGKADCFIVPTTLSEFPVPLKQLNVQRIILFDLPKNDGLYKHLESFSVERFYVLLSNGPPRDVTILQNYLKNKSIDNYYIALLEECKNSSHLTQIFNTPLNETSYSVIQGLIQYIMDWSAVFSLDSTVLLSDEDLASLKSRMEYNESLCLDTQGKDIISVNELLLEFLRNIPNSLVPADITNKLVEIASDIDTHKNAHYAIQRAISDLPKINKFLAEKLFQALHQISRDNSSCDSIALAELFGKIIFNTTVPYYSVYSVPIAEIIIRDFVLISNAFPYMSVPSPARLFKTPKRPPPADPTLDEEVLSHSFGNQLELPSYAPTGSQSISLSNSAPVHQFHPLTTNVTAPRYLPMNQYHPPQPQYPMEGNNAHTAVNMRIPPPVYPTNQQYAPGIPSPMPPVGYARGNTPPPSYHVAQSAPAMQHAMHNRSHSAIPTELRQREDWELGISEITFQKKIGSGSFGEVWKCEWAGITVAVKKIHVTKIGPKEIQAFREEISIMTKLRHPNIIQFLGACLEPDLLLVTEFADRSSLFDVLKHHELTWDRSKKIIMDIARGMLYLHTRNPPIVHRDIKSLNILVTQDWKGVVADFGLTTIKSSQYLKTFCGSPAWTAPEVLRGHQYDESADVFSYGIVLWEVLSRKPPYEGLEPNVIIGKVISSTFRPPIPPGSPGGYVQLMTRCWDDNPHARPTFKEIVQILKGMFFHQN